MAVKIGKIGAVKAGANTVAEMGSFTLSGFTREVLDKTSFGDDIKEFTFGVADGGEITFSGNYDNTDTNGQKLLESACENGSKFNQGDLKFYLDNTTYFTVGTGGNIIITKVKAVNMDKAGLGKIDFTAKVSGAEMYLTS